VSAGSRPAHLILLLPYLLKEIYFVFGKNNETTSYFFWRRKRSKKTLFPYFLAQKEAKTSTPSRPSPILEGSTQKNADTAIFLP
jgi:hypothetical protein